MSDGSIIKPECIPREAWHQSGLLARPCFVMLGERLEKLERRLGINSGNPSRPPSTDGPGVTPQKTKAKSSKKRGGQARRIKRTRSRSVATELPGEQFGGIIGCHCDSAYSHLDNHRLQF